MNDVSFNVKRGEWLSIIGHNGSGKSTLVSALDGLISIDSGSIEVDSIDLNPDSVWEVRDRIGLVFQNPDDQFVGATVEDDVAFGLQNHNIEYNQMHQIVNKALDAVGMSAFKMKSPSNLSGGQKQRVALAGIIALHPQIIILDESTNMLDPAGKEQILSVIMDLKERYKLTVISITHDVNELKLANRILVMNDGKVVDENTPSEIFSQPQKLINMGLTLPYPEIIKRHLNKLGVETPDQYLNEGAFIKWIQQFPLKK
ncbi:energy-coupling factor transporter ATPase [Nicoliella spurrieriana]|uniref:Energy-coupling factor transporter ATPase n=1 Tax=Nicoliella spurrieriana TaxID=2925830 RepID=A0A976RR89_9LACO|nr:energy-coupling factor transporter ATPase [Nicoliella spurrieriana]UQS86374.1 energy-coupling factor transporter ATPase [Nicoliella spurrieriana]